MKNIISIKARDMQAISHVMNPSMLDIQHDRVEAKSVYIIAHIATVVSIYAAT